MSQHVKRPDAPDRTCTVSVVSHGQGSLVEDLLGDLARTSSACVSSIIVTRNLPDDPIRLPEGLDIAVRIVDNPAPRGFGANHNSALASCTSRWFAVLNPDLRLQRDPFETMLSAAADTTALLTPRVLEPDGREADSARALPTPARLLARFLARYLARSRATVDRGSGTGADATGGFGSKTQTPEWFAGMFMLLRTDALRAVGGFDERYFMYCEDVDLCARLRLAGWDLRQVPAAAVVHDARRASRRSLRHLRWHVASLARLWTSGPFWRYRSLLAAEHRARSAHRMARN